MNSTLTIVITGSNDAPVAINDDGTVSEDNLATGNVLTNDADVEGDTLSVSQFQIAGVTGTFAAGQIVTIPGVGTIEIDPDGAYSFQPTANFNGTVPTITYTVVDGAGGIDTADLTINVTPVNDAPVNGIPAGVTTTLEDTALPILGLSVTDPDSSDTPPQVLTTTLSIPAGVGALSATGGTYDAATGILTITGTAGQINAALATVRYTPVSDFNTGGGTFAVTMTTSDGVAPAAVSSFAIAVTPVADIVADIVATLEDRAVSFNPLGNDNFENGARLVTSITQPAAGEGTAVLNGDGTITFTPPANFVGPVSFTYTVTSGGVTETATITVDVGSFNDAPEGRDATVATAEDTPRPFTAADFGFSDPNDSPANALLSVIVTTLPANGTLRLGGVAVTPGQAILAADIVSLVYTPAPNANGPVSFTFQVVDDGGIVNGGQNTDQTPNTFTINVTPVNDAPVAVDDTFTVDEDGTTTLNLTGNDADADGNSLSVQSIAGTTLTPGVAQSIAIANGTINVSAAGVITFTPNANYNGPIAFDYVVSDGTRTDTGLVNGLVTPVNDAPVAQDDSFIVAGGSQITLDVLGNDTDADSNPLMITEIDGQPVTPGSIIALANGSGTVRLNADGTVTFTPAPQYSGPVSFTYTVSDGTATDTGTVNGTVASGNQQPDADNDAFEVRPGESITIPVLDNDDDPNGDLLTIVAINGNPVTIGVPIAVANGVVVVNVDGTVTFTPASGFEGTVSFTYTISDGQGGTDTATVSGEVLPDSIEIDPPRPPVDLPRGTPPPLTGHGIVYEGVGNLRGTFLTAEGIVTNAADYIDPLNGISGLAADGVIAQVVHQVDNWRDANDRLSDFAVEPFRGGSALQAASGDNEGWFRVDTIIKEGVLHILVAAGEGQGGTSKAIDHTITLGDGRALPNWLTITRGGVAMGYPPVGLSFIDIRIQAVDGDGNEMVDQLRISLPDGAISDHAGQKRADTGAALFSTQTMRGFERDMAQSTSLADALFSWSALGGERRFN